jgi:quercetin dioxygenase-like cupin family protein
MFEMVVPPNAKVPAPHYHRDWEETVYGLEGSLAFTVAGAPTELKRGDVLFIPRRAVHGFVNETQADAKVLSVLTPGVLGPEYFREISAALSGSTPPDPKKIGEIMSRYGLVPAS